MARSVSYVSAAKLVSMARGNPRVAIIDVRYARGRRLCCSALRRADLGNRSLNFGFCPLRVMLGEQIGNGRDDERSHQAHIEGSHHFASGSFAARMPELARAASGKDTLVFHCALSQVPDPPPSFLSLLSESPNPASALFSIQTGI